jgi:hypothetical protein
MEPDGAQTCRTCCTDRIQMRLPLLTALVAACGTHDLTHNFEPPVAWTEFPERTQIVHLGAGHLDPDGPPLIGDDGEEAIPPGCDGDLVVMDPGEKVGVIVPLAQVDLLIYLDRADLESHVVSPIDVDGVELDVHLAVEVLDEEADSVQVEFGDDDVWAEAWVPRSGIDQVWTAPPSQDWERPQSDVWLRGQTVIRHSPEGQGFAWVDLFSWDGPPSPGVFWLPAMALDAPHDGYQEVLLEREGFRLQGFVAEADLAEWPNGGRGFSYGCCCRGGVGASTDAPTVPAGTNLYLEPFGPWIGRTSRPIYRELGGPSDEAWRSLEVDTPWGLATVWMDADPE